MQRTGFPTWLTCSIGTACTCIMLAGLPVVPAQADDTAAAPGGPGGGFESELGLRYWGSWGKTAKNLYGITRADFNSRLTYSGLSGHAGELFGQASDGSFFVKGYAGLGIIRGGKLQDEDFPPGFTPYSSTLSNQRNGSDVYATIDVGRYFLQVPGGRIGGFIGYNFFDEKVNAYGCTQTATYPSCLAPPLPAALLGISQDNRWHSLRLGVNGEAQMGNWRLSGEAAGLPLVLLRGNDRHHLRICSKSGCFAGPVPEDGHGWGYQLQTMLDYRVTPDFSLGLGLRYWHMQTRGYTHFEGNVVGDPTAGPQPVDWKTTIFGVTTQATLHF